MVGYPFECYDYQSTCGANNQFVFRMFVRKFLELHSPTRFKRKHLYLIPQCCIIVTLPVQPFLANSIWFRFKGNGGLPQALASSGYKYYINTKSNQLKALAFTNGWNISGCTYIETGRLGLVLKVKAHKCNPFFPFGKVFLSSSWRRKVLSGALLSSLYFSVCLPPNDFGYILAPYDLADRKTLRCTQDVQKSLFFKEARVHWYESTQLLRGFLSPCSHK